MSRVIQKLSPERAEELQRVAALIDTERTDHDEYFRRARQAADEPTFSGQLRRAIHAIHDRQMLLPTLLQRAGVDWATLEPFMLGESSLPSDVIDRLVDVLQLELCVVASPSETL